MKSKMVSSSSSEEEQEEEKLVQMVHDFIESRSPSSLSLHSSSQLVPHDHHHHSTTHLTLQAILGSVKDVELDLLAKVLKFLRNVKLERKTGSLKKWLVMRLRMDGVDACLCKSKNSWITTTSTDCARSGDYEYIGVVMKDQRLIVDLDFNSQFELARPTSTYTNLLKALPSIFVGAEEKLLKMVSILCSAAKQSLKERGLHIPPWRKTSYMQSKWISESQRLVVSSTGKQVGGGRVNSGKAAGDDSTNKWSPPKIMPKRRDLGGGGSALTSQFSNMSINCC